MPTYGWRYLLSLSTIPILISIILVYLLPESARFYLTAGKRELAIKTLEEISQQNRVPLPDGELITIEV